MLTPRSTIRTLEVVNLIFIMVYSCFCCKSACCADLDVALTTSEVCRDSNSKGGDCWRSPAASQYWLNLCVMSYVTRQGAMLVITVLTECSIAAYNRVPPPPPPRGEAMSPVLSNVIRLDSLHLAIIVQKQFVVQNQRHGTVIYEADGNCALLRSAAYKYTVQLRF